jgi:hypothetical protein
MAILFSGDFHAGEAGELPVITKRNLIQKYGKEMFLRIKWHIILGDGGFMWHDNQRRDSFNYKVLNFRPFPVFCVVGNHEPILGMTDLYEADVGIGETVYKINDNPFVAYLKRGKVYIIEGLKILVLGGALSGDIEYRKESKSWWKNEYWTEKEKQDVFKLIEANNKFDLVISHTGPDRVNRKLFECIRGEEDNKFKDDVAFLNENIDKKIFFHEWWCGHFHHNRFYHNKETNRGYQYLYKMTKIVEKTDNEIVIYSENTGNNDGIRKYKCT